LSPALASRRRSSLGYVSTWALGIGVGAVALGAFVGFLVNGPPLRPTVSIVRSAANVAPPTPAAPNKPAETKTAAATPPAKAEMPAVRPEAEAARDSSASAPQPAVQPAPPPNPLATPEVREVQGRLRAVGFNPGPVDGAAGPQTAAAVKQYQQARGLQPTGVPDKEVLARLRQEQPQPPPPPQHAQAPAPRPQPRYASAPPPPPRDPLLESIERLFRR
jgi:hypothetical protein